jgi:predicted permease
MKSIRAWFLRFGGLFDKQQRDHELAEEMESHLQMHIEDNLRRGMSAQEARRQALIKLGGMEQTKEDYRDRRGLPFLETLWQDIRYGLRMVRRNPGFSAIAVFTLALGIGANTAIFSIVNGVLLKPLPYPEPQEIVKVWGYAENLGLPKDQIWFSAPEFVQLQQFNKSLTAVAAMTDASFNITANGGPERVEGAQVTPAMFSILGVRPAAGRVFTDAEGQPGHDQVLMLGYGLWKRRFGADPSVIGRTLAVNGRAMTIVGVLPLGFNYPYESEMWQPLAFGPSDLTPDNRGNHGYEVIARLKPNVTLAQGRADMQSVAHAIMTASPDYPYKKFNYGMLLVPLLEETVGDVSAALWVLCGAVGLVLLIVCVNVASLLLARASAREREVAIRLALGAGGGRIIRQLLTESILLSGIGGIAGLLLAPFALHEIVQIGNVALPRMGDIQINGWVLLFAAAISIGTGILFGLAPALQAARTAPFEELKEGSHGASESGGKGRTRRVLIVCETALSVILLVGAGLLMRSFLRVLAIDPGFHSDKILTMRIALPQVKYSTPVQNRNFFREAVNRVAQLPGVQAAGATYALPLTSEGSSGSVTMDTQDVPADQRTVETDYGPVTPGYFEAMGFQLLEGRFFNASDTDTSAPVAIIDDTLAHSYFRSGDPIGRRVKLGGSQSKSPWISVVGVVRHIHYRAIEAPSRVQLYWPESQDLFNAPMSLAVRTSVTPLSLATTVIRTIQSLDADQPVYQVRDMTQLRADWVSQRFLALLLVGLFAGIALVLAAVGIYGVMAYSVTRRTHEIGIRLALGAQPRDVLRMMLWQGTTLTGIGLVIGVAMSFAVTRLMSSLLYGVSSSDPLAFLAGAAALFLVALAACYIPAYRATRVDPVIALRHE